MPIASTAFGNPYPYYFYLAVHNQQFNGIPLPCSDTSEDLPVTDVVNGLSVKGYLNYEIPADLLAYVGAYSLVYQPPTGSYNVQYVNEGVKSVTQTQVNTQTTTTKHVKEQVIMETYDWTDPSTLIITLRNVLGNCIGRSKFNDKEQGKVSGSSNGGPDRI